MLFFLWSLVEVHVGKITANVYCKSSVKGMVLSSPVLFVLETTSWRRSCCMKRTLFFPLSKVTLHAAFTSVADPGHRKLAARFWAHFRGSCSFTLTAVTLERRIQPQNCKSWMVSSKVGHRKKNSAFWSFLFEASQGEQFSSGRWRKVHRCTRRECTQHKVAREWWW